MSILFIKGAVMKKRTLLSISAGVLMSTVLAMCSPGVKEEGAQHSPVKNLAGFNELKALIDSSGNRLLVFDMYADWCGPCRILSPTFQALANDHSGSASFYRINVDRLPDVAAAFGTRGIPYVVFVKDKQAVYALTGVNPRESYERVITGCGSSVTVQSCKENLKDL